MWKLHEMNGPKKMADASVDDVDVVLVLVEVEVLVLTSSAREVVGAGH